MPQMVFSRVMLTGVGRFQSCWMAYIQGLCKSVFVKPRLSPALRTAVCSVCLSFVRNCLSSPLTHFCLVVCGSVLQQVYTVELFFVSHPGLGGKYREECRRLDEEGSNRDRGRGPLFRNFAGLERLCCTISVHHWCQHSVGYRISATTPPFLPHPLPSSNCIPTGTKTPMEKIRRATLKDAHKWIFLYEKKKRETIFC